MLTSRSYGPLQVLYGRSFYMVKRIHNKWNTRKALRQSIELDGNSTIGIHHNTLFNLSNSKIKVKNGSLKIGIDFGYFDGGVYDSRTDKCTIQLVNSTLEIEGNVSLFPGVTISAFNARIIIKNGTIINGGSQLIAKKGIEIGENCLMAYGISIRDNDGHKLSSQEGQELDEKVEPVRIGNHCWLGQRAMILKGVTLHNNVIVAAGSVVAKSVDAGNLVAGVPAKVIKENVKWSA